jgi:hypothetical protein
MLQKEGPVIVDARGLLFPPLKDLVAALFPMVMHTHLMAFRMMMMHGFRECRSSGEQRGTSDKNSENGLFHEFGKFLK